MASSTADVSSVHLPKCTGAECQSFLREIETRLAQHNVACISNYGLGGLYKDCFHRAFVSSSCTVVHVCQELLKKVVRVKDVFSQNYTKVMFVQIHSKVQEDSQFDFLLDYNVADATSADGRQKFLQLLVERFSPNADLEGSENGSERNGPDEGETTSGSSASARNLFDRPFSDDFQTLPLVLRVGTVSETMVNKHFFIVKRDGTDLAARTASEYSENDVTYLSHQLVPAAHGEKDLLKLAGFVRNTPLAVQFQSLQLMGLLLLERRSAALSSQTLWKVERILFTVLETQLVQSKDTVKSLHSQSPRFGESLIFQEFLASIYLLLLSVIILQENPTQTDSTLQTVLQRPFFKEVPSSPSRITFLSKGDGPGWYKAIKSCLTDWKKVSCKKVQQVVLKIANSQPPWKMEARLKWQLKLPLLVASLLSSLKESKPVYLAFLDIFEPKKDKSKTLTTLQRMISCLAVYGLASFLLLRSGKLSSADNFLEMCKKSVLGVIGSLATMEMDSRIMCLYHTTPLLFSKNKSVRQNAIALLRVQSLYNPHINDLLLLEATFLTWPMLKIRQQDNPDMEGNSHASWARVACDFGGHKATMHLHRPTTPQHLHQNNVYDTSLMEQDGFFRELAFLKSLQHQHVVQLIACHEASCPKFYVTEDYLTTDLQSMLVNKSRSGHHFSFKQLVCFLLDALEAIQFCHDKNVVHRNLTSASLFITAGDRVKLSGFKHTLQLTTKSYIRDYDLSFVATRWSAPESLQDCCFSVASDLWMVAHLMYEVLTHGRLPYSDTKFDDEGLMPKVVNGQIRLNTERCIPQTVYNIIYNLTCERKSASGNSARGVAQKLRDMMASDACSENVCKYFPDISSDSQAATKHSKGPVLTMIEDFPGLDYSSEVVYDEPGQDGPKKGPVHFVMKRPGSFGSKEWTVLCEEGLPSVTKLIGRPTTDSSGHDVLPFIIPAKSLCSLKDAVTRRMLGTSLEPYVLVLRQLANSLAYMHSRRIILCDFSADTIHIESLSNDHKILKVWITSLPWVKVLPEISTADVMDQHVDLETPTENERKLRSAPEVKELGQYSVASDIYCFGALAYWVFFTFSHPSAPPLDTASEEITLYENALPEGTFGMYMECPECCPDHIFEMLLECCNRDIYHRPRMDNIREKLFLDLSSSRLSDCGYTSMPIANPSVTNSSSRRSSLSSGSLLNEICNASEQTDDDADCYDLLPAFIKSLSNPELDIYYTENDYENEQTTNTSDRSASPPPPPLPSTSPPSYLSGNRSLYPPQAPPPSSYLSGDRSLYPPPAPPPSSYLSGRSIPRGAVRHITEEENPYSTPSILGHQSSESSPYKQQDDSAENFYHSVPDIVARFEQIGSTQASSTTDSALKQQQEVHRNHLPASAETSKSEGRQGGSKPYANLPPPLPPRPSSLLLTPSALRRRQPSPPHHPSSPIPYADEEAETVPKSIAPASAETSKSEGRQGSSGPYANMPPPLPPRPSSLPLTPSALQPSQPSPLHHPASPTQEDETFPKSIAISEGSADMTDVKQPIEQQENDTEKPEKSKK